MLQAMERTLRRVMLMLGRGRITVGNDGGNVQRLQVQLGQDEVKDGIPRLAEYGFTSMPPAGSDALVVFIGGERTNGAIVATGHQASRMKGLAVGEVAIYDDQGQSVHITRNGIVITGAGKQVLITGTPKVRIEADLDVQGEIKDMCDTTGTTMAHMRDKYNIHKHPDPQGGQVGVPTELM